MFKIAGLKKDELLRHVSILFSGMMVVHVCNLVYQMVVSRILPESEYTLLAAFLGVLAIIQRPLTTLTAGMSRYSSLLQQDGYVGDVRRLLRKWLLLTGAPALLFGLGVVLWSEPLAGFLNLERMAPVMIAGAVLPALFCSSVLEGAGQGLQLFGWSSVAMICGALVRLGLGAGFVYWVYPACGWAMLGHGLGIYATGAVLLAGLLWYLRGGAKSRKPLPSLRGYLLQSFFILTAYSLLMTGDIVLVKHFCPGETDFAYAATLGRIVIFLPGAIVAAMFPKVASRGRGSDAQFKLFLRSLAYTGVCVAVAVGGCVLFSGLLARILFGIAEASLYLQRLIGWMAVVMGFSALLNVVVQFLLAQRLFSGLLTVPLMAAVYLAGAYFFPTTYGIVAWAGIANLFALVGTVWFVLHKKKAA